MDAQAWWSRHLGRPVGDEEVKALGAALMAYFRLLHTWDAATAPLPSNAVEPINNQDDGSSDRAAADLAYTPLADSRR